MKKEWALVIIIISMVIIFFKVPLLADRTVNIEDGKKVLLKDDMTWEYVIAPASTFEITAGFRKATWGMSMTQTSTLETAKILSQNKDMLFYSGAVNNLDCMILYIFDKGKLVGGKYIITKQHANRNDYISDYNNFKQLLTKKYGPPSSNKQYWRNDLYKNSTEEWGLAVSSGDLSFDSQWQTTSTEVTLRLSGDTHEIRLVIEYHSAEPKNPKDKSIEDNVLQEL